MWFIKLLATTGQANCGDGSSCSIGLPVVSTGSGQLQSVLQILFAIIAAIAVLIIVVGGLRFVLAENPQDAAKARGTIIYAAVGLVITLAAEAIVSFVLTGLK